MARSSRVSAKGLYHHIFARGNNRNPIFKHHTHYEKYLHYLELYSSRYAIGVIAYALIKDHIHLFIFDTNKHISQFINSLHGRYAQFFNQSTKRIGHVFGGRYKNKIVQINKYGLWLSRYIHRQAVELNIVKDPSFYQWTSYRAYIGQEPKRFIEPGVILEQFGSGRTARQRYKQFVLGTEEEPIGFDENSESIIGDEKFIENIEATTKHDNKEDEIDGVSLIKAVANHFKTTPDKLLMPRGFSAKRLRHKVFLSLVEKYCLSASRIGKLFNVTPMAVTRVLEKAYRQK